MSGTVIAPGANEGFVYLARSKQGRIFEKHILNYGDLLYPGVAGGKVTIDDDFADKLMTNFANNVCDIVQVPTADDKNNHSEDPMRNIGEVVAITKRDNKIYAHIDARKEEAADQLGKTLLGASAMMHLNYTDTKTGDKVGPTLLHVAVTNRPFITELEDFSEVLAASVDGTDDAVLLTAPAKEIKMPTKDELIKGLLEHGVDVAALSTKAAKADEAVALSNDLTAKLGDQLGKAGILTLSNGDTATSDDIVGAVADLGTKTVELSNKLEEVVAASNKNDAIAKVDALIASGHIVPAEKDARVDLYLSNKDLFEKLVPSEAVIKLSQGGESPERGFDDDKDAQATAEAEIARLSATPMAKQYISA